LLLVTGGAGFIGSNVVAALNDAGRSDVVVCDLLGHDGKWRNLAKRQLADIVPPAQLASWLEGRKLDAVIHLGAISETTATDGDLVIETNFRLSMRLLDWCTANAAPFIYASSAATYGDGAFGFDDDNSFTALTALRPLNTYGWSKALFDLFAVRQAARDYAPPQWVGLKFFNVYGPNEEHKQSMKSVASQIWPHVRDGQGVQLFKSYRSDVPDGGQKRDFVYVRDVADVVAWLVANPQVNGVYNLGSGEARTFEDMARAVFKAAGREPQIDFIPMPPAIRDKYQYFTQASMERLRAVGYSAPFTSLEDGISDYVGRFLSQPDPYR
jgi:ADP-L-glycero-D-manno-heptose 6-epimerase